MKQIVFSFFLLLSIPGIQAQSKYTNLFTANHDLYYAREASGKWGYVDVRERVKIPFKYDNVSMFSKTGFATVASGGKFGIIDTTGKQVIPFIYDYTYPVLDMPYIIVQQNGQFGATDTKGNIVVPINCTYIHPLVCYNNTFIVVRQGRWGVVNNKNETKVPFNYTFIRVDDLDGLVTAFIDNKSEAIDINGKKPDMPDYKNYYLKDGGYKIVVNHSKKWGVINKNNELVVPCEYNSISQADNNPDYFIVSKNSVYGVVNAKTNKLVLPIKYPEITGTTNDIFFVYLKQSEDEEEVDEAAFFDLNGNQLFNQTYSYISNYKLNEAKLKENKMMARVGKGGYWGIIGPNGKPILPFEFMGDFSNYDNLLIAEKKTGWGVMELKGNIIIPFGFYHPDEPDENPFKEWIWHEYFAVKSGTETGVIDKQGRWIIKYNDGSAVKALTYDRLQDKYYLIAISPKGVIKITDVRAANEMTIPVKNNSRPISVNIKTSFEDKPAFAEISGVDGYKYGGIYLFDEKKLYISNDFDFREFNKTEDVFIGQIMVKKPNAVLPEYIYGLVDKNKKLITPIHFDDLDYQPGLNLYYARKDDKITLLDRNGKLVISTVYDTVMLPLNKEGDMYIRSQGFRNGYVSLRKGNKQLLLSSKGETLVDNTAFKDNFRTCIYYETFGTFYCPVSQFVAKYTSDPMEGWYKKKLLINNTIYEAPGGNLNSNGRIFIKSEQSNLETNGLGTGIYFVDGLLCLRKNGKFGYIDCMGKEAIPFVYDEAGNFEFGLAFVKKDGEYYAVNRRGEKMIMSHPVTSYLNSKK